MAGLAMEGKVALVTGGASGIGWATARLLAAQGARVMVADLDAARASARCAELGPGHASIGADMSDASAAIAMVEACVSRLGRLDVLVNNAGRTDSRGLALVDHDRASFDAVLSVNMTGSLAAARAAIAVMAERGGCVINVASGAAFRALPLRGSYSASKAGVVAMTEALAGVSAGVRVNAVAPGFVRTELVDGLIAAGRLDPAEAARKIPIGRLGAPEEIAAAIGFLVSASARQINGATLVVDGGSQAFGGSRDASADVTPRRAPERGVLVVIANGQGGDVIQSLAADGALVERIAPAGDAEKLDSTLRDVTARHGAVLGVVDAGPVVGPTAGQALAMRFETARQIGRLLVEQGHGAYVAAIDRRALADPVEAAAFAASHAMLVKTLACEWAPRGVHANAIHFDGAAAAIGDTARFLLSDQASFVVGSIVDL